MNGTAPKNLWFLIIFHFFRSFWNVYLSCDSSRNGPWNLISGIHSRLNYFEFKQCWNIVPLISALHLIPLLLISVQFIGYKNHAKWKPMVHHLPEVSINYQRVHPYYPLGIFLSCWLTVPDESLAFLQFYWLNKAQQALSNCNSTKISIANKI